MHPSMKSMHSVPKLFFATFQDFAVNPITENRPVFLQLVEAIWKTVADTGKFLHSLVLKNMTGYLHFTA